MNRNSSRKDINWSDLIQQTVDFMIKNNLKEALQIAGEWRWD